ncbi:MAG: T9SS type A sorting domain-containing protein [Lewinellaceae bacterium]|nr:T9SS type A sorting domain-containing protein [Saprospiraceae bacterium]MCB9333071.1 T9SS type A sorting domain-containing protein [Lewinellaceae bacterium]
MKSAFLLCLFFAFLSVNAISQNCTSPIGAIKIDAGGAFEQAEDFLWTSDGNLVLAGYTSGLGTNEDGLLLKVTPSGDVLWAYIIYEYGDERFKKIKQCSDGGFIMIGSTTSLVPGRNMFLVKTTSDGVLSWARTYDYLPTSEGYDVIETSDGGFACVGRINGVDRMGIMRTDANGVPLWGKVLNGSSNDYLYTVAETVDGNILVAGTGISYSVGKHDFIMILFDGSGNVIWQKHIGSPQNDGLFNMKRTPDGGFIVTGGTWDHSGGAYLGLPLLKLDPQGEIIWSKQYGIEGRNHAAFEIQLSPSGGYYLAANEDYGGKSDFVMEVDDQGNLLWAFEYDNPFEVEFYGLKASPDGCLTAVGKFGNATVSNDLFLWDTGPSPCRKVPDVFVDTLVLQIKNTFYSVVDWTATKLPNILSGPLSLKSSPVICPCASTLQLDLGPDLILCQDSTVILDAGPGFATYHWQDSSSAQTFAASTFGTFWVEVTDTCGTVQRDSVTISPSLLGDVKLADTTLCAGDTYTISVPGFDNYTWAPTTGLSCNDCPTVTIQPIQTTTYTLLATTNDGCVKEDTFTVTVLPLQIISDTLEFCPGESVSIGGQTYDQPGIVTDTIPDPNGCPLVLVYVLRYATTPNSDVSIECVEDINIATIAGTGAVPVDYDLPTATSDCPCPGVTLTLTEGLPPGSLFPVAKTKVCYEARDSCGNVDTCCFHVIVREALPCDTKEIGCMRWELLRITQNAAKERTYRIRAINKCTEPMIYTAFELPDGTKAVKPAENSVYITPDGRDYLVRNPNFSPFYSIRFKSLSDSIANGKSDIFEYTLPPQSEPDYIHVMARLTPQQFFEAYLNTFNCPVEQESKPGFKENAFNSAQTFVAGSGLRVFPNPTTGTLFADLSDFSEQAVQLRIFDATGKLVQELQLTADSTSQAVQLKPDLPEGLYVLQVQNRVGERQAVRFVLLR